VSARDWESDDFGGRFMEPRKFKPKLDDVWYFQKRDTRYGMPGYKWGLIAGQIVKNLLWHFTSEGDVVLDPMAGGGTTIDVCKEWNRTCLAFDIEPVRDDIIKNDLLVGLPEGIPKAHLAFLDPPYMNMKVNDAFLDLRDYVGFLRMIVKNTVPFVRRGGFIALINCDQIMIENRTYPLVGESYVVLKEQPDLEFLYMISVPFTMQQFNGTQVVWAKKTKHLLGRNRQMFVFQKKGIER